MLSLIPSHRGRPSDDPIFSLNRDASDRSRRGESVVNATIGVLLDDHGALALLPTASRIVREVSPLTWAAYAPIAGPPDFLRAVVHEVLATEPELETIAVAVATPGGPGALHHAITCTLEPGQALLTSSFYWGPYHTSGCRRCRGSNLRFSRWGWFTTAHGEPEVRCQSS